MSNHNSGDAEKIHRHLHSHMPGDTALRIKALESLAVERGMVTSATLDAWVEAYSEHIGPKRGAQVVAKAWSDTEFKTRLLENAARAIAEIGYEGHATGDLKAVENTATTHNLVVCTLCSCYPFGLLGISPPWYRSAAYRARAVREPRIVLEEFGVNLAPSIAVHVWDSTAEIRYLVLPQRPSGTDDWNEDALAAIVTRNSMIGTDRNLTLEAV